MAMPTPCEISAIGRISASTVRAAQFGRMRMRFVAISRARASTCSTARGPAPGRPMFAESMPSDSIKCRSSIFSPMVGSWMEGFCRPSRSVSSFSITCVPEAMAMGPPAFQSCIHSERIMVARPPDILITQSVAVGQLLRVRAEQHLAKFAAVNFGAFADDCFHFRRQLVPAFQVAGAELSFFVALIARALLRLAHFNFGRSRRFARRRNLGSFFGQDSLLYRYFNP